MSNNLEISVQLGRQLLPCLKWRLDCCEDAKKEHYNLIKERHDLISGIDVEITQIKTSIAELEAKLAEAEKPPVVDGVMRFRRLKGHAAIMIEHLLAPLQGNGLTISEIRERTGLDRSLIYKTLHRETEKFEPNKKKKRWRLKNNLAGEAGKTGPGSHRQPDSTSSGLATPATDKNNGN